MSPIVAVTCGWSDSVFDNLEIFKTWGDSIFLFDLPFNSRGCANANFADDTVHSERGLCGCYQ